MTERKTPATAPKKAGKRPTSTSWTKGSSGNPAGRKPGTRNRATVLAEAVLEKDVEAIAKVVTAAAIGGDLQAARMVLERLVPQRRERPVDIDLPDVSTIEGVNAAQAAILNAVAAGELLPGEGTALAGIVEQRRRAIETEDLEKRIEALEREGAKK